MPKYQGFTADYLGKPYDQSPLLVFLDGTFHPDWRLDDPSVEAAVASYLRAGEPAGAAIVVADLESVVDQMRDPRLKDLVARHLESLSEKDKLAMDVGPWLLWLRRRLLDPKEEERRFQETKSRVMASSVPSSGDDLLGMQIDCDAYLEMAEVFDDIHVRPAGDAANLLRGSARARPGIAGERVVAELEWVWLSELRYRHLAAHMIRIGERAVALDFVTQIDPHGFYVTGSIEVVGSL